MAKDRNSKRNILKFNTYFDYTLFFLTIFLVCFGLIMIYSSSSYVAQRSADYNYDAAYFLKKQLVVAILGTAVMLVASKIPYKLFNGRISLPGRKKSMAVCTLIYIIALIVQLYVLIGGSEINGKKRWLMIGSISFQPSDFAKFAVIIFVAYNISKAPRILDRFVGFMAHCLIIGPMFLLIAKANLSTALIVAIITAGMCFVASKRRLYYFVTVIGAAAGLFAYLMTIGGYRSERFQIWLNIDTHEKGYQIRQGLYAIASGGLTGNGLGNSMQKLGYIPEAQNDMIFTVICEELGIIGAIITLFLFAMMLYRIYIIAINAPDLYSSMICVGVMLQIAAQVLINVAVVTNAIPSTGIALPFISYGGTSLLILMGEMGVVLGISNCIRHGR